MGRFASAAIAAIALGLGLYGAGAVVPGLANDSAAGSGVMLFCLLAAALAVGVAIFASWKVRAMAAELERVSRSLDAALSGLAARAEAASGEAQALEARLRAEFLAQAADRAAEAGPATADVIALGEPPARRRKPAPDPADVAEIALAERLEAGDLELSLQPIVSVASNAAVAFETWAHVEAGGQGHDIHRLAPAPRHADPVLFERTRILRAAEVARRRLGSQGDRLPLHCPVSELLLKDLAACAEIAELVVTHPALADQIVPSLPSSLLLDRDGAATEGIDALAAAGLGFAAEGWDRGLDMVGALRERGAVCLKLPADRLLDRVRMNRKAPAGAEIAAAAASFGLPVVATAIRSDEDAVELLDLGVDLMVGPRFSEPRRLRPADPARPARVAEVQAG
jgi:cyclic-di-GMP phosphodiesterase TipF (flagellum assembly factor)